MTQKKGKKIGWWIGGILLAGLLVFGVIWACNAPKRAQRVLEEYAYEWNLRCPYPMAKELSLNRVVVLPGRILVYQLSGINMPKEALQEIGFDLDAFRDESRQKTLEQLRADPALKEVKRLGVTFRYSYKDPKGAHLIEFDITPEDYK